MKKAVAIILVVILLAGAITLGYMYYKSTQSVGQGNNSSTASQSEQVTFGVIKTPDTHADVMDALAHEISQNADTVGWLVVPGTQINNSVVQSNNNSYYLRLTERKESDVYGCYFADYECNIGTRDIMSQNTIIYGHSDLENNPDGKKFSELFKFKNEDYARSTPNIFFSTLEDYMTWQVFAVFYTKTDMQYIYPELTTEQFIGIIKEAKEKSLYNYNVDVTENDKIITLSTCASPLGTDYRFVVMARLMPEDYEALPQADFTVNQSPRQP